VIQGQAFDGALSYTMGIFNGAPDGTHNDEDENSAKDYEGRLFVKPFAFAGPGPLSGLGVGVAGSYGRQKGTLPTYRTPGRQTFFSYASTASADGVRTRVSPQAYYYVGPIGLTAEYVRSAQQVSDGAIRNRITFTAWQAAGSVVLGGKADYKGAKVTAPFDPSAGQWGALEVGLRYGQLRTDTDAYIAALADPATAARIANNFGAVANWWLSTGNRLLLGLDHTSFVGGASTGNRASETVFVTRLQGAL
jgi:phosphate-selective porin OprO and OprP